MFYIYKPLYKAFTSFSPRRRRFVSHPAKVLRSIWHQFAQPQMTQRFASHRGRLRNPSRKGKFKDENKEGSSDLAMIYKCVVA